MLNKERFLSLVISIFFLCLWLLTYLWLFHQFYLWNSIKESIFLTEIPNFLWTIQIWLVILSITSWLLFIYGHKEKIENIDLEHKRELVFEHERKTEFWNKFPKINKIFMVNWVVRGVYVEGKNYALLIVLILFVWLLLRFFLASNISSIIVEEQFHYIPAKNILESWKPEIFYTSTEFMEYIEYKRTYLYTMLTAWFFRLFWVSEISLRIVSIIFSLLSWLCIYILLKKLINKNAWLVWLIIFSILWWAVWYWIFARHYVIDAFLMIALLLVLSLVFIQNKGLYWKNFFYLFFLLPFFPWIEVGTLIYIAIAWVLVFIFDFKKTIVLLKSVETYIVLFVLLWSYYIYAITNTTLFINVSSNDKLSKWSLFQQVISNVFPLKFDSMFFDTLFRFYPILFIFFILSILLSIYLIIKQHKKYYMFLYLPIFLLFMSVYDPWKTWNSSQYWMWEPRHVSIFIAVYVFTVSLSLYYMINLLKSKKIMLTLFIIIFLQINPYSAFRVNYKSNVSWTPYQVMTASAMYIDFKKVLLIKDKFDSNNDLLIYDTMEVMYRAYWDKEPNKRIWWVQRPYKSYNDLYDDVALFDGYIKENTSNWKRIWIIESTYNSINFHSRNRKWNIRNYLETNEQCKYYSEGLLNIYLFTNNCISL